MTATPKSGKRAFTSLRHVLASGVAHEIRTTVHQDLMSEMELGLLKNELTALGAGPPVIQNFRETGVDRQRLDAALKERNTG